MKVTPHNNTHASQYQPKNWGSESKIPMPGSDGVSFKDLVAVKSELQALKISAAVQKK